MRSALRRGRGLKTLAPLRDEDGMTLVELVVSFLILGIVIVPLSTSVVIALANTERADQRTTNTTDQQILASYLVNDIQSSDDVLTSSPDCGAGSGTSVLQLHWVDAKDSTAKYAAYVTSGNELLRVYCEKKSADPKPVVQNTVVVMHALESTSLLCDGANCAVTQPGSTPETVTLTVAGKGTSEGPSVDTLTFTISGTRRVTAP